MLTKKCAIFGCLRDKAEPVKTVTLTVGEDSVTMEVCDIHHDFLKEAPSGLYQVGYTYTNEVEIRPVPIHPAAPSE